MDVHIDSLSEQFLVSFFFSVTLTHIAQNIAETCQKYSQSFIATEILSEYFCQILQNILSQHCNFNYWNIFENK